MCFSYIVKKGRRGPLDRLVSFTTIIIVRRRIRARRIKKGAVLGMYKIVFP